MAESARPALVAFSRWPTVRADSAGRYLDALRAAGLQPIEMSWHDSLPEIIHGLVIPGGLDVDPDLYSASPHPETQKPDRERDNHEIALVRDALIRDIPVLAICRGHQLLNVALGGGLLQHIEGGRHEPRDGESACHEVAIEADTRLADAIGAGPASVNSRHHQAVTRASLAPGLRITAVSDDGLVEGFESEFHRWAVGVQWHPERSEPAIPGFDTASRALFLAFAAAARECV
jgi:putative glutamine amidotransferase